MRVLVISDVTGYMRGGVPAVTRKLIDGLAERGHTVGLCGDIPLFASKCAAHFPISVPMNAELASQVQTALTAFDPDFVHVMAMSSRGLFALIPVLASQTWLLTCHSIPPYELKLSGLHGNDSLHYGMRNVRYAPNSLAWRTLFLRRVIPQVVVHSVWVGSIAVRYGHPARRTEIISLGCDDASEAGPMTGSERQRGPRIVTVGGIAHTKGYHDAINALALIRVAFPDVRYQIIGEVRDRSYLNHLEQLISRHRLQDQVLITPNLSDEKKRQALTTADLYLQPSHEEGFCLAFMEAALCVPRLVGADAGAIRLMCEGDVGARVTATRRPDELAEATEQLMSASLPSDLLRQRRGRLVRDFNWKKYLDAHEMLYMSMMTRARTARPVSGIDE